MADDRNQRHGAYVERVHEDTQRYLKDLLQENDKLRILASTLQRDNESLQRQLTALSSELERQERDHSVLRAQLADFQAESQRFTEQFEEVEQRNLNLANLYVSSYQLHGTLNRDAVLVAMKEIIINLIGSEEFGIFEVSEGGRFDLIAGFGIDEARYASIGPGDALGRLAAAGETFISGRNKLPDDVTGPLTLSLPLLLDGRVTGVIVLFRLLSHKPALQELDFELFDLLGSHAATALYCTRLYAQASNGAAA